MAVNVGSVTVASDGTWSGGGLALVLMNNFMADYAAALAPLAVEKRVQIANGIKNGLALPIANGIAAAVSSLDVRVPADSLDSGVPSVTRVLAGAVE